MDVFRLIAIHEGLKLNLYKCPAGKWTIGYGRNLEDRGISIAEADFMLQNDISDAYKNCARIFQNWAAIGEVRQAALIDMCHNLGAQGLSLFVRTVDAVNREAWEEASKEMLDSRWAKQVGKRATRLSDMIRTGQWPVI